MQVQYPRWLGLLALTLAAGGGRPALAEPAINFTPMNILWEVNVGGTSYYDYMTTPSISERDRFPSYGAIFYVPSAGPIPLYRLERGQDHMDSLTAGEGGYSTDGPVGYPFTSQSATAGLTEIARYIRNGDHGTFPVGFNPGGYTLEGGFGVYGYRRYFDSAGLLVSNSGGGIVEQSNSVAGGATYSWIWNGTQFLNTDDYGRYMQSDIFFTDPTTGATYDPIEAGDEYGPVPTNPQAGHGSPTLLNQVTNSVHITRAAPLEFFSRDHFSASAANPLVYVQSQIGKDLTLNFEGLGPVAQYKSHFILPASLSGGYADLPAAYLTSSFGTFYLFDGMTQVLTQLSLSPSCPGAANGEQRVMPGSGYGGIIAANSSGTFAIGIYGVSVQRGGPVTQFVLDDFRQCYNTSLIDARRFGNLVAGDNAFNTYIVTGTLSQITSLMRTLYSMGVN